MALRHPVRRVRRAAAGFSVVGTGSIERRCRSGREVVVKAQRAEARDVIKGDMRCSAGLAEMADKRTDLGRRYGFSPLLGQFRWSLVGSWTTDARPATC